MGRPSKLMTEIKQAIRQAHTDFWQDVRRRLPWAFAIALIITIVRYWHG